MTNSNPWRARMRRVLTWNTLVLVRLDLLAPLPEEAGQFGDKAAFRWSTPDDYDRWKRSRPDKADSFVERLRGGREMCFVGLIDDEIVAHCWYEGQRHRDTEIGYTFEAGPKGVYQWEGWVVPHLRKHGMSRDFMNRMYQRELPARGFEHILSYYAVDNEASKAFHAHYGYRELGRLLQLRVFGRYFYIARPSQRPA